MGTRGPLAKRSDEPRAGHSMGVHDIRNRITVTEHDYRVVVPEEDPAWDNYAKWWYRSLRHSGQSKFFENSDWMSAFIAADVLSQMCEVGYSAGLLAEWNDMASRLLVCEADRRRVNMELVNKGVDPDEQEARNDTNGWRESLAGEIVDG